MFENILIIVMCLIAIGGGLFAWWVERGPEKKDSVADKKEEDNKG